MDFYSFGIEVEAIVKPHIVREPLNRIWYYKTLVTALRDRGLDAEADTVKYYYRKHGEHYESRWWITKEGSLGYPSHPTIPIEAVSPILDTRTRWEDDVDKFWDAMRAIFHTPEKSFKAGTHIHVTPGDHGRRRAFTLEEMKILSFGIVMYEPFVLLTLPVNRRRSRYCRPNTKNSTWLRMRRKGLSHEQIAAAIFEAPDVAFLIELMQKNRYVLWNFEHFREGSTGTLEFRGGRCLRGEVMTKRWIAFVIAFIDMVFQKNHLKPFELPSMYEFWNDILWAAGRHGLREYLPSDYRVMSESLRQEDFKDIHSDDTSQNFDEEGFDSSSTIVKEEFKDDYEGSDVGSLAGNEDTEDKVDPGCFARPSLSAFLIALFGRLTFEVREFKFKYF